MDDRANPNAQRLADMQAALRRREAELAEINGAPRLRPVAGRLAVARVAAQRRKIERFLADHPDARPFSMEPEIREEARRQGILERVARVAAAFNGPGFGAALNAALQEAKGTSRSPRTDVQCRDLVIDLLHGLMVDPADVLITLFWSPLASPPKLRLSVRGMTPQARQRCLDAVLARQATGKAA